MARTAKTQDLIVAALSTGDATTPELSAALGLSMHAARQGVTRLVEKGRIGYITCDNRHRKWRLVSLVDKAAPKEMRVVQTKPVRARPTPSAIMQASDVFDHSVAIRSTYEAHR